MNTRFTLLLLSLVLILGGAKNASAIEPYVYVGGKYGIAFFNAAKYDDGKVYSGFVGYQVNDNFSVEGEVGHFEDGGPSYQGLYTAAYGVGMIYGDRLYAKVKAGVLYENINAETSIGKLDDSDLGLSYGIGGGVFLDKASIDVEIVTIEQDIYTLTGGVTFEF